VHVLGTAGHVDHGKSALVRALTGTEPDRFIEERLRGMTLDLGFAHLRYPDGIEAAIVDVPGHERFLHNMLAGAAGMELLLLVVAANEGPRPQTAEHLALLAYLNVRRAIVVMTKADLVDPEELAFSEELAREAIVGTVAEGAPIVAVSSLTGSGLDVLREEIHRALVDLPPRAPEAPAYLPIDRVFSLAGYGTIVTGTLMQGRITIGDELQLAAPARPVRVRGLQVFGEKRKSVAGGARVALNLPGIETSELARGDVLSDAQFPIRSDLEVTFRPLPIALPLLKRRTPVRAYIGSAELLGTLVFERVPEEPLPLRATLRLREPTVAVPGAAFVVRRLSPKTLLGGGTIGDAASDVVASAGDTAEVIALLEALRGAGLEGLSAVRAGAAANLRADIAGELLASLVEDGRALELQRPVAYIDASAANDVFARALAHLTAGERAAPWSVGATALALSRAVDVPERDLARILAAFADDGRVAYRSGYYASPGFVPELTPEQRAFFEALFAREETTETAPLALDDVRSAVRLSKIVGIGQAFETLLASGALARVGDAVYRGEQIARIRARLEAALRKEKQITVSAFRELAGTSRKFAVPLLEWFDATGVTMRSGDVRVLRRSLDQ
jgi:selenocysteine-specific elongation factor